MSNFDTATGQFTSSTGRTVKLQAVSPFLIDQVKASVAMPEPPTYTVTTATGGTETWPHDETTLATDDDKKAWAAYKLAVKNAQAIQNDRVARLILSRGVQVDIPNDGWREFQTELGVKVPESPIDLKVHFITTEVIGTPEDLGEIVAQVMGMSTMNERAVGVARDSFRLAIQRNTTEGLTQATQ